MTVLQRCSKLPEFVEPNRTECGCTPTRNAHITNNYILTGRSTLECGTLNLRNGWVSSVAMSGETLGTWHEWPEVRHQELQTQPLSLWRVLALYLRDILSMAQTKNYWTSSPETQSVTNCKWDEKIQIARRIHGSEDPRSASLWQL